MIRMLVIPMFVGVGLALGLVAPLNAAEEEATQMARIITMNGQPAQYLVDALHATYIGRRDSAVFDRELLKRFFQRYRGSDRALGFDTPAMENASAGRRVSRNSVGHLGFTGTSFWLDLDTGVAVILLANRVHPSRDNTAIRGFRQKTMYPI